MREYPAGNLRLFEFDIFKPYDTVVAAVTTRSTARNRDFSLARGEVDNRNALAAALGFKPENLLFLRQVHSNTVVRADGPFTKPPEADAMITDQSGLLIGGLSADCPIILFYDPAKGAIGMAHGSWRGTVGWIAPNTVERMAKEFGSKPVDIRAAIGPGIGPCCYEVGPDVADAARASSVNAGECITGASDGKFILDLWKLNRLQLVEAGLADDNIDSARVCTKCVVDTFFSYRAEGEKAGRTAAVIGVIEPQ